MINEQHMTKIPVKVALALHIERTKKKHSKRDRQANMTRHGNTRKIKLYPLNKGISVWQAKTGHTYFRISISTGKGKSKAYYAETFKEAVAKYRKLHFKKYGEHPKSKYDESKLKGLK